MTYSALHQLVEDTFASEWYPKSCVQLGSDSPAYNGWYAMDDDEAPTAQSLHLHGYRCTSTSIHDFWCTSQGDSVRLAVMRFYHATKSPIHAVHVVSSPFVWLRGLPARPTDYPVSDRLSSALESGELPEVPEVPLPHQHDGQCGSFDMSIGEVLGDYPPECRCDEPDEPSVWIRSAAANGGPLLRLRNQALNELASVAFGRDGFHCLGVVESLEAQQCWAEVVNMCAKAKSTVTADSSKVSDAESAQAACERAIAVDNEPDQEILQSLWLWCLGFESQCVACAKFVCWQEVERGFASGEPIAACTIVARLSSIVHPATASFLAYRVQVMKRSLMEAFDEISRPPSLHSHIGADEHGRALVVAATGETRPFYLRIFQVPAEGPLETFEPKAIFLSFGTDGDTPVPINSDVQLRKQREAEATFMKLPVANYAISLYEKCMSLITPGTIILGTGSSEQGIIEMASFGADVNWAVRNKDSCGQGIYFFRLTSACPPTLPEQLTCEGDASEDQLAAGMAVPKVKYSDKDDEAARDVGGFLYAVYRAFQQVDRFDMRHPAFMLFRVSVQPPHPSPSVPSHEMAGDVSDDARVSLGPYFPAATTPLTLTNLCPVVCGQRTHEPSQLRYLQKPSLPPEQLLDLTMVETGFRIPSRADGGTTVPLRVPQCRFVAPGSFNQGHKVRGVRKYSRGQLLAGMKATIEGMAADAKWEPEYRNAVMLMSGVYDALPGLVRSIVLGPTPTSLAISSSIIHKTLSTKLSHMKARTPWRPRIGMTEKGALLHTKHHVPSHEYIIMDMDTLVELVRGCTIDGEHNNFFLIGSSCKRPQEGQIGMHSSVHKTGEAELMLANPRDGFENYVMPCVSLRCVYDAHHDGDHGKSSCD